VAANVTKTPGNEDIIFWVKSGNGVKMMSVSVSAVVASEAEESELESEDTDARDLICDVGK
jgi:hypothetical protein